jgi:hypothetical protein
MYWWLKVHKLLNWVYCLIESLLHIVTSTYSRVSWRTFERSPNDQRLLTEVPWSVNLLFIGWDQCSQWWSRFLSSSHQCWENSNPCHEFPPLQPMPVCKFVLPEAYGGWQNTVFTPSLHKDHNNVMNGKHKWGWFTTLQMIFYVKHYDWKSI